MSLAGSQNNPINVNFHYQKSLEFFDKKISWQNLIKKDKEIKVSLLVPIRVKLASMWAKLSFLQSFVLAINQSTSNQFAERKVNSDILQRVNWSNMIFDFFVYWLKLHQDFDRESAAGIVFFWQHVLIYSGTVRLSQVTFTLNCFQLTLRLIFRQEGLESDKNTLKGFQAWHFLRLHVGSRFR